MDTETVTIKNLKVETDLARIAQNPEKEPPFNFYIFHDLLNEQATDKLRDDIGSKIKLSSKDNDLYKFRQSKDLKSEVPDKKLTPAIRSFIKIMLDDIKPLLEQKSGLALSDKNFDITASRYDCANYLLCHNDDMKDPTKQKARALAFIYYLTSRPWTRDDGGALILYDSDASGEPVKVNNYIHPKPNTLVVFKTGSKSWHSVQEVFCKDDQRLSINGWFHLANPETLEKDVNKTIEPSPYDFLQPIPLDSRMERFFEECVNGQYLMEKTCYLVRRKFKRNSEINLPDFLVKEKFQEISKALREAVQSDDNLEHVGPYNKRNYKRIKLDSLPQVCRDLFDAFRSELFFMLLSRLTGINLQPSHLVHEKQMQESSDEEEEDDGSDNDGESVATQESAGQNEVSDEAEEPAIDTNPEKHDSKMEHTNSANNESDEAEASKSNETESNSSKPTKRKRDCDPITRLEFRHLDFGSYTLIHDYSYELGERLALDVVLHFNHDFEVSLDDGGYLSYIDVSEDSDPADCELLKVEPKSNCLSLIYRSDESTCRFMKYITRQHKASFQDLSCVFYERSEDLPDGSRHKKMKATDETT